MGRGRACDIVLEYAYVSRLHARVELTNSGCVIADCGSTNGTFLNGKRVEKSPLENGDRLRLGRTTLLFLVERSGTPFGKI